MATLLPGEDFKINQIKYKQQSGEPLTPDDIFYMQTHPDNFAVQTPAPPSKSLTRVNAPKVAAAPAGMLGSKIVSTAPQMTQKFDDKNGYYDPKLGIFVNTRGQRPGGVQDQMLGEHAKQIDPNILKAYTARTNFEAERAAGQGVRPGAVPPMNAVQAARGQVPTNAMGGAMAGSGMGGTVPPNQAPRINPTPLRSVAPIMSQYPGR